MALIAVATLLHTLASTVRERRQDFAILKTLGFVRRQVRTTVAWQATTLAVLALALGIRLGAATGRWSWRVFANDLGIVPDSIVPVVFVLVTVVVAIVAANAVAGLPARIAARTRPASVLRSE